MLKLNIKPSKYSLHNLKFSANSGRYIIKSNKRTPADKDYGRHYRIYNLEDQYINDYYELEIRRFFKNKSWVKIGYHAKTQNKIKQISFT